MTDLRKAFWAIAGELASSDDRVRVLTGDLGYSFCEDFQRHHPKKFINAGIAEQNMIGVAAGMALGGLRPLVYSGAIFALMRPYEQVRDDMCYNNLPVILVGTGASGFLGPTHNFYPGENEHDLLKALPNIQEFYPKTEDELRDAISAAIESNKPVYIRL